MNSIAVKSNSYQPYALAVLRIVVAFLFIQHASAKFISVPFIEGTSEAELFSIFGLAGIIELVGSILLFIGLWVRPVAFVLAGHMAVAYLFFHVAQWGGMATLLTPAVKSNSGESAVLFCFVFLYLFIAGAGAWALDKK